MARETKRRSRKTSRKRSNEEATTKKRRRTSNKKSTKKRESKFSYRAPSREAIRRHQKQSGADYDSYINQDFRLFRPQEGDLCIRILPATWEDPEYWAYPIYVHYDIGPDGATYLCNNKIKGDPCPVCEESADAFNDGDTDYGKELKARKRMLVWIIDRDNEDKGPLPWAMPWTFDKDISKLIEDRRTGEILLIDHPEEGYDVEFTFEKGKGNPYKAPQIAREATPISDDPDEMDEWLEYIEENPLPDLLNFYSYEHIEAVFSGEQPPAPDAEEEEVEETDKEDEVEDPDEEEDLPWDDEEEVEETDKEDEVEDPDEEDNKEEEPPPRKRRRSRSKTRSSSRGKRGEGRKRLRKKLKEDD